MPDIRDFDGHLPVLAEDVYIDRDAVIIGNVEMKAGSSCWPGSIIRADYGKVIVGEGSHIMDKAFVESHARWDTIIGERCIVRHGAILHGCRIGRDCLIGIGAIILDGASIGDETVIGAGCIVSPEMVVPPRSLVMGPQAQVSRDVTPEEVDENRRGCAQISEKLPKYRE
ncbi:MAG: gamma carbonic anhydrase family protein [Thermoplasmata archaeon HGW-Thermoplasmata-1]|nr:MAG: gamma carbonic anhydrase family protein [Thermoplasmata archaeon HGW-Thermoplasmata-1]